MGNKINMGSVLFGMMGLMFMGIGNYMPKVKQNYSLGIKVTWTLNNEENWNATHRLAGKLWTAGGLLMLLTAFLPGNRHIYAAPLLLGVMVLVPVAYSWWFHRKQKGETR